MREEQNNPPILDILCIGEIMAGKSFFLKQYTCDQAKEKLHASYDIYAKIDNGRMVYFHQLSEQETLYLQKQYDGILFFIDLFDTWNVVGNILKWLDLYSKFTGVNVFKIPIRVIVTKARKTGSCEKEKKSLQRELMSIVQPHQIIYFEGLTKVQKQLEQYFDEVSEGKAEGIKSTNQNHFRLFGISEIMKYFVLNVKLTFFRCAEAFDKNIKNRIAFNVNLKLK